MKAQYAQEISAAHMQITDFQKTVEETLRRAEEVANYCGYIVLCTFKIAHFLSLLVKAQNQLPNAFEIIRIVLLYFTGGGISKDRAD